MEYFFFLMTYQKVEFSPQGYYNFSNIECDLKFVTLFESLRFYCSMWRTDQVLLQHFHTLMNDVTASMILFTVRLGLVLLNAVANCGSSTLWEGMGEGADWDRS